MNYKTENYERLASHVRTTEEARNLEEIVTGPFFTLERARNLLELFCGMYTEGNGELVHLASDAISRPNIIKSLTDTILFTVSEAQKMLDECCNYNVNEMSKVV